MSLPPLGPPPPNAAREADYAEWLELTGKSGAEINVSPVHRLRISGPGPAGLTALPVFPGVQEESDPHATALRVELDVNGVPSVDGWFHARGGVAEVWRIAGAAGGADLHFSGRWLHWRVDASGRLARAISHAGATLRDAQGDVALQVGETA